MSKVQFTTKISEKILKDIRYLKVDTDKTIGDLTEEALLLLLQKYSSSPEPPPEG